jgi:hypothetical protein
MWVARRAATRPLICLWWRCLLGGWAARCVCVCQCAGAGCCNAGVCVCRCACASCVGTPLNPITWLAVLPAAQCNLFPSSLAQRDCSCDSLTAQWSSCARGPDAHICFGACCVRRARSAYETLGLWLWHPCPRLALPAHTPDCRLPGWRITHARPADTAFDRGVTCDDASLVIPRRRAAAARGRPVLR